MSDTGPRWHIRAATLDDVQSLVGLEERCFDYSRMGARSFRRLLKGTSAHIYVCTSENGQLIGYYLLLTRKNSRRWRLYSIAAAPEARGSGLGRVLLEHAIHTAQKHGAISLGLEVKVDNSAAIRLYEKLNFAVIDLLPGYYDDGTDGYRMRVSFTDATNQENR
ncbi:GNAT family N-acetyltransferase [Pseudidiomarina marina]|uniref:N-acetyltransferase n=1 Tax=Pseudidiomarina marina TaxID=502366 RepID=A0A432YD65_9GAMM|nr:GNAT family N-acetyltransferase [Pseudidiomarina marina]PHR65773.1 MAG: GNAT family N-acetyltransferase [Idiomarina sp.]RUO58867.1 N-acetyltransferase [Pseudidiomarina marina]